MRKLLFGLLLAFLTVNVSGGMLSHAYATEPEYPKEPVIEPTDPPTEPGGNFTKLPTMVDCSSAEIVRSMLTKYEEVPFAKFTVMIQIPGGQILQQPGTMFVNPKNGSWSIVALFPESNMACILQNGAYFSPASMGEKTAL